MSNTYELPPLDMIGWRYGIKSIFYSRHIFWTKPCSGSN
jgi:hypothetical protein